MEKSIKIGYYILLVSILMVTVGWASLNTSLDIDVETLVKKATDIRVTGITYAGSINGGISNWANYKIDGIEAEINLPNSDSEVTYVVTITNYDSQEMALSSILSSTDRITYTIRDRDGNPFNFGTKICDDRDITLCNLGSVKDLYITLKYSDLGYDSENTTIYFNMIFNFLPMHNITYINSDGDYPTEIMHGNTLEITFDKDVTLKITDGIDEYEQDIDYTLEDKTLIFPNVESDLVIEIEKTYDASEVGYNNELSEDNCETVECALNELYRESKREIKVIKYENFESTYIRNVLSGKDLTLDFTSEARIPNLFITSKTKTYVEGTDYTYTNGILVIPNIQENLVIKAMMLDASEVGYSNSKSMCNNLACAMDEVKAGINPKVVVVNYHNVDGSSYPRNLLAGSRLDFNTNFGRYESMKIMVKSKTKTYVEGVDYTYVNGNFVIPSLSESIDVYFNLYYYDAGEVEYSNALSQNGCTTVSCALNEIYSVLR